MKLDFKNNKINAIIPMAGMGSRFLLEYDIPKFLIPVNGKPMIQSVIENLNIDANFTFIVQEKHNILYKLDSLLNEILPNCNIINVDKVTDGSACTALLAEKYIDTNPLLIINCDQMIHDFNINELLEYVYVNNADGVLGSFISTSTKNSYIKLDIDGNISEIEEKIVISNMATNGLHFWKCGKDFVYSANKMIELDDRYNNEFYIAPTYNYLIKEGKKILPFFYNLHFPIGTPDDLKKYKDIYESR
jgi:dTDP-glucose pyrophosphorylase